MDINGLPDDCLYCILLAVDSDSQYKAAYAVSKLWNETARRAHPDAHRKFADHLLTLIKLFPDKPWRWAEISYRRNITWDIVTANPDAKWDWHCLSHHPDITWDIVVANSGVIWDWHWVSRNPNITWDVIAANPDKAWSWYQLSQNEFGSRSRARGGLK